MPTFTFAHRVTNPLTGMFLRGGRKPARAIHTPELFTDPASLSCETHTFKSTKQQVTTRQAKQEMIEFDNILLVLLDFIDCTYISTVPVRCVE